jgi:hypothetical protein
MKYITLLRPLLESFLVLLVKSLVRLSVLPGKKNRRKNQHSIHIISIKQPRRRSNISRQKMAKGSAISRRQGSIVVLDEITTWASKNS